jgi:predicted HD superfamily hydrolase involved in NAD metabolism
MKLSMIRHRMEKLLKPERFKHTLGVERMAAKLAQSSGLGDDGVRKARVAALLHDAGKSMTVEKQVDFCYRRGLELPEDDLAARGVVHSRVSVSLAVEQFEVRDPEILSAIRWHTTGHGKMGLLDKILFAADYLDPGRKLRGSRRLRKLTSMDLEAGVLEVIREKMEWIIRNGEHLHPDTLGFYNSQAALLRNRKTAGKQE